jgi:hypothetical protein
VGGTNKKTTLPDLLIAGKKKQTSKSQEDSDPPDLDQKTNKRKLKTGRLFGSK